MGADVAARQGTIQVSKDHGSVQVECEAGASPIAIMRGDEQVALLDGARAEQWNLHERDVMVVGSSCVTLVSITSLGAHQVGWRRVEAPVRDREGACEALVRALDHVSQHPGDLDALVEALDELVGAHDGALPERWIISNFTGREEYGDEIWCFEREAPQGVERSRRRAPDPLSRLGTMTAHVRDLVESWGDHAVASDLLIYDDETYPGTACVIAHAGRVVGMLIAESAHGAHTWAHWPELAATSARVLSDRRARHAMMSVEEENRYFLERDRRHYMVKEVVWESASMRAVYKKIEREREASGPLCILGEAGSGKELIARAIHHMGPRADGVFVSVQCAAHPPEALGVELFGCVASEISGAIAARKGIFEMAHEGTVYLEEFERLSLMLQGRLAHMIRQGEIRRVGDEVGRKVTARLIVGTHHDLKRLRGSRRVTPRSLHGPQGSRPGGASLEGARGGPYAAGALIFAGVLDALLKEGQQLLSGGRRAAMRPPVARKRAPTPDLCRGFRTSLRQRARGARRRGADCLSAQSSVGMGRAIKQA